MSNWSEQLQDIGFEKTKQADGAVSFHYQASHRRASFWTQITVKQVGRPSPDSWQVTYSRAELQIGIWKIHNAVKNMDVIVYTNDGAMINDIQEKCNANQLSCKKSAIEAQQGDAHSNQNTAIIISNNLKMSDPSNSKSVSFSLLALRLVASALMVHHGLEKLSGVEGFTTFVVDEYFPFLPFDHTLWTLAAAYTQIIGSALLLTGLATRAASIGLASTMAFALLFHGMDTGLQGAPLGIVDAHNYEYEASALYFVIFAVLSLLGGGRFGISGLIQSSLPKRLQPWA